MTMFRFLWPRGFWRRRDELRIRLVDAHAQIHQLQNIIAPLQMERNKLRMLVAAQEEELKRLRLLKNVGVVR